MAEAKFVLVTGCSSGIGLATALALKERGFDVIATARTIDGLSMLRANGLHAIHLDTGDLGSVKTAIEAVKLVCGGKLFGVFHNAGYGQGGAVEDLPVVALEEQFRVNVFGAHALNLEIIPMMRARGEGRIIWNSSILGFFPMKYRMAYTASKFAIEAIADTMRLELAGSGIQVSLLEPGPISTLFRKNSLAAFEKHINAEASVHREAYKAFTARLGQVGDTSKFTLPASACVDAVIHALESKTAKARYRVTTPTKMAAVFKRILTSKALDKVAAKGI